MTMASPQAEAIKQMLVEMQEKVLGRSEPPTLEEMRANAEGFNQMATEPDGVTFENETVGGVPCTWAIPDNAAEGYALEYVHGGGYVIGSAGSHRRFTGHFAKALGCRVVSVDYRLAPEHPHPAAVEDSTAVYRALLDSYEPDHLAVSGDSAGGGLTMATLVKLRDDGTPLPAAGVPISPWVDMEALGESMQSKADADVLVGIDALKGMADMFLAGQDARDPLAAPLYADLRGLPPIYIVVGGDETLLNDSTRLATSAAHAGVAVRLDSYPEMQHIFPVAAGNMPEADDAVQRMATFVREAMGLG